MILIHKNRSFFFKNINYTFSKDLRKKFKCVLLSQTKIFIKKNKYKNKIKIGLKKILNRRLFLRYKRKIKLKRLNKKKINKLTKKKKIRSYNFFFFYLRRNKMKSSPRTLISKFKNFFIRRGLQKKEKIFFQVLVFLKDLLKKFKIELSPLKLIQITLEKIIFFSELRRKKKGSTDLFVPTPISRTRGFSLALKLLFANAKLRTEREIFFKKLALELVDTYLKTSNTYREILKYNTSVSNSLENIRFVQFSSNKIFK